MEPTSRPRRERPSVTEPWHLRKDLSTLLSVMLDISSELNIDELLHKIISHATNLCDADAGFIALISETGVVTKRYPFKTPEAVVRTTIPPGKGAIHEAIKKKRTIIINVYPDYPKRIESFVAAGIRSVLATPIMRAGKVTGVMEVFSLTTAKRFTRYHAGLLEAVATQAAVAFENARLYENLKESEEEISRRAKELTILNSLSNVLSQTLELDIVLNSAIDSVLELLGGDGAVIFLLDEQTNILKLAIQRNLSNQFIENSLTIPVGYRLPGVVADTGKPLIIENLADHPEFEATIVYETFKSLMGAPIKSKGRVIGAFLLGSRQVSKFTWRDATFLESIGNEIGIAIENSRLYEAQRHISESLQRGLLPAFIPSIPGVEIGVRYSSATEEALVGGDFYDIYNINGKYALVIGDVSGKGIEAAASTSMMRYILRAYLYHNPSPSLAMTKANDFFRRQAEKAAFITMFCAVYDPETSRLFFVNAGHPYPCLLNQIQNTCTMLSTDDPAIGIFDHYEYRERTVNINLGNLFVAYTDGVIEARSGKNFFGEGRLIETLLDSLDKPTQGIADSIISATMSFSRGKLTDDIALIILRKTKK